MKYIYILLASILLFSCEDWLDVNQDPNNSVNPDPESIFTGALVNYVTNRTIDLGPAVSTASQLWSGGGSLGAGVFTSPEIYQFSIFTTGNTWRSYYRSCIKNLRLVSFNSQDRPNIVAQSKIFEALCFYSATVLWEDVPFSEAVDVDFETATLLNQNPKFDSQQEVLTGIVSLLDEAISFIDVDGLSGISTGDLIYGGDMDKWRKFAKSLKLRVLVTLAEKDPSVFNQINTLISEGDLIVNPSDNASIAFYPESGNRNPFYQTLLSFAGGQNFFYFASEVMVNRMKAMNDPRLPIYFTPNPSGDSPAEVVGSPAGVTNIGFVPWMLSASEAGTNSLVRPDAPDVLFSAQETHFLIALAIAKGYATGTMSDIDTYVRQGVDIAMNSYGVDTSEIADFLTNSLPDLNSATTEEALSVIGNQLFIDNVVRPLEGWTYWRIVEYPELSLPQNAVTQNLVRRLPLPPDELEANENAATQKPLDTKMWFDQ